MNKRVGLVLLVGVLFLLLISAAVAAQDSNPTYIEYTVQPGDNLTVIAARFNTTPEILLAVNEIANPNRIKIGTVLRIPTGDPALVPTLVHTPTPGPSPTAEPSPVPTATPAPLPFELGGEVAVFTYADEMRRAGMTWAKLAVQWSPGDSLDAASQAIEAAQVEGFKVLLQISGSPDELSAAPDSYIPAFASYLQQVASLAPEAIEVWSEMNLAGVSPTHYAALLRTAYEAIKRGNSSTLVITGALGEAVGYGDNCDGAQCDELAYLRQMARTGVAQQYADCIGIRYTLGAVPPDAAGQDARGSQFIYYYPSVVTTYATVFTNKPLCFTGIGYFVPDENTVGYEWAAANTLELRAEWLAMAAQLAKDTGRIRLFIVYRADEGSAKVTNYAITSAEHFCLSCLSLGSVMSQ